MNKVLRIDKITKTEIGRAIGKIIYEGYRGGYRSASNQGWTYDPSKKKHLVDRIYRELKEDPYQVIEVAIYNFNEDNQEYEFKADWYKLLAFPEGNIRGAIKADPEASDYVYRKHCYTAEQELSPEKAEEFKEGLSAAFMEGEALTGEFIRNFYKEFKEGVK